MGRRKKHGNEDVMQRGQLGSKADLQNGSLLVNKNSRGGLKQDEMGHKLANNDDEEMLEGLNQINLTTHIEESKQGLALAGGLSNLPG